MAGWVSSKPYLDIQMQHIFAVEEAEPRGNFKQELHHLVFAKKVDADARVRALCCCALPRMHCRAPLPKLVFEPFDAFGGVGEEGRSVLGAFVAGPRRNPVG